jgi:hypothetical protein
MKKITQILLITILLSSCANEKPFNDYPLENGKQYSKKYELKVSDTVTFPLDTETGFFHVSTHYTEFNEKKIFSLFNSNQRRIYVYDYDNNSLIKTINYEKEGPNGIGNSYSMGHYIKNLDTAYLYGSFGYKLLMTNHNGEVLKSYKLLGEEKPSNIGFPMVDGTRPMYQVRNKMYLSNYSTDLQEDHTLLKSITVIDLNKSTIDHQFGRPEIYNIGNWGQYPKYSFYQVFNPINEKFIYGFGVEPYLYETDLEGNVQSHFVGSEYFSEITPFSKNKDEEVDDDNKLIEYDYTTPSYGHLHFDKKSKLFFRVVYQPTTLDKLREGNDALPFSIIIFDETFKKLGETYFENKDGEYMPLMTFVNENGFHIANQSLYGKNESLLSFTKLKNIKI